MNDFLDKLGLFDFLGILLPGIYFECLFIYFLKDCSFAVVAGFYLTCKNAMLSDDKVLFYFIFFLIAYAMGILLDQFIRILRHRKRLEKFFIDYRKVWFDNPERFCITQYIAVKILEEVKTETSDCSEKEETVTENYQKFVHQYCMTYLELEGEISKAEKMTVLSEMCGLMFMSCFLGSVMQIINLIVAGEITHNLVAAVVLMICAYFFYERYLMFARFRVSSTLRSFYISRIKKREMH